MLSLTTYPLMPTSLARLLNSVWRENASKARRMMDVWGGAGDADVETDGVSLSPSHIHSGLHVGEGAN